MVGIYQFTLFENDERSSLIVFCVNAINDNPTPALVVCFSLDVVLPASLFLPLFHRLSPFNGSFGVTVSFPF